MPVQLALEHNINDNGLQHIGHNKHNPAKYKVGGDGGKIASHLNQCFLVLQCVDSNRREAIIGFMDTSLQSAVDLTWQEYSGGTWDFVRRVQRDGYFYNRQLQRIYYIDIMGGADLSMQWKLSARLIREAGLKVFKAASGPLSQCGCHSCDVVPSRVHIPKTGVDRCVSCIAASLERCWCHKMTTSEWFRQLEVMKDEMLKELPRGKYPAICVVQVRGLGCWSLFNFHSLKNSVSPEKCQIVEEPTWRL